MKKSGRDEGKNWRISHLKCQVEFVQRHKSQEEFLQSQKKTPSLNPLKSDASRLQGDPTITPGEPSDVTFQFCVFIDTDIAFLLARFVCLGEEVTLFFSDQSVLSDVPVSLM